MKDCCKLADCGFFRKYQQTRNLACKGFIGQYCKGPKQEQCKRMEYRKQTGHPPPDDMMPSGYMISAVRE